MAEYVSKMPAEQEAIYYLTGESSSQLRNSPYLEAFGAKGYDVLLLTDPIDEFAMPGLREYKGKKLLAADRAETKPNTGDVPDDVKSSFEGLLGAMKHLLPDVSEVRLTTRLTSTAACLVADVHGMNANLERLMRKWGQETDAAKRILELNPNSPAVLGLKAVFEKSASDSRVEIYSRLLFDQAAIAEGSKLPDPAGFAKRLGELIAADAGR